MELMGTFFQRWDSLGQTNQILLLALVVSVLVLVVAIVVIVRRRKSSTVRELGISLKGFRERNPCFYRVMTAVVKAGKTSELTQRGDVRAALRLLQDQAGKRGKRPKKPERTASLLSTPTGHSGKDRQQAATMTILRAVYMDETLCRALPNSVIKDIDRYLDSLTG